MRRLSVSTKSTKFQLTSSLLVTDHCHLRAAPIPRRRINCSVLQTVKLTEYLKFHWVKSLRKIPWAQMLKCLGMGMIDVLKTNTLKK